MAGSGAEQNNGHILSMITSLGTFYHHARATLGFSISGTKWSVGIFKQHHSVFVVVLFGVKTVQLISLFQKVMSFGNLLSKR